MPMADGMLNKYRLSDSMPAKLSERQSICQICQKTCQTMCQIQSGSLESNRRFLVQMPSQPRPVAVAGSAWTKDGI